jgi:hypothetical protein
MYGDFGGDEIQKDIHEELDLQVYHNLQYDETLD